MNVMWYAGKFDEATWHLFAAIGITPDYLRTKRRGMVAVQQNIAYRRELLAGDLTVVRSRLLAVREKVVVFHHTMRNAGDGEVAAECEITGVHLDRDARKSTALPPEIQSAAQAMLDDTGASSRGRPNIDSGRMP
jgi:acyl-CoA thioester hydrolase